MEVGARHDGFCDPLPTDTAKAWRGMGDSGPAHEVDTFSSCTDDLHTGGILLVVRQSNHPTTWSASIHSVGQRPEVYGSLLEELPKGYGDTIDHEYSLPPTDRRSVEEDYTGVRGHAASMRLGS